LLLMIIYSIAPAHSQRPADIKPQNILIKDGNVLFADFGLAKDFASTEGISSTTEGYTLKTPMYAAPEAHDEDATRTYSADIFPLGCIFTELSTLLSRRSVSDFTDFRVDNRTGSRAFHTTLERVFEWMKNCDPAIQILCRWMLDRDPKLRPSALQLIAIIDGCQPEMKSCAHAVPGRNNMEISAPSVASPHEVHNGSIPSALSTSRSIAKKPKNHKLVLLGDGGVGKSALVTSVSPSATLSRRSCFAAC
jgi:serine/threonine protein kinase